MPDIRRLAVPMHDLFNRVFSGEPSYRGGRVILAELKHKGALTRSRAYSGDIAFIEGGKEALEQLEIHMQELDKATWDTAPPFAFRFIYWAVPMLIAAMALPYRQ